MKVLFLGEIGLGQTSRMRMRALAQTRPRCARRKHRRALEQQQPGLCGRRSGVSAVAAW